MIPCITLWQPWASWIMEGWKTIETRTHPRFATLAYHYIGIHAGMHWDNDALRLAGPYLTKAQIEKTQEFFNIRGVILGTVWVDSARILTEKDSRAALIDCGNTLRYGLCLSIRKHIEPIKAKGSMGIWYHDLNDMKA